MESTAIVVGGGLAGLTAATYLARSGFSVDVLERSAEPGGRARTQNRAGALLNQGPHALYLGGPSVRILSELGVRWSGGDPARGGALRLEREGTLHRLPRGFVSSLRSTLFGVRDILDAGRVAAAVVAAKPADHRERTWTEWLDARVSRARVRDYFNTLARIGTYGGESEGMSAEVALMQLQAALAGVRYVDGGWQALVDGLRDLAASAGVRLHCGEAVSGLAPRAGRWVVTTRRGERRADRVVLAVDPATAQALLPDGTLDVAPLRPVRASCLDLVLDDLPVPDRSGVFSVEEPLYFVAHSRVARLAPPDAVLVHAAEYAGTGDVDAQRARARIEAFVDRIQPGWRAVVRDARFAPTFVVHHALVTPELGGLAGRPGPAVVGAPGVFLAGDWVGDRGWLLDAGLSSARRAAELAVGATRPTGRMTRAA